ncbi:unnamed protein product [Parnassius apollo]|uniref:(apollo) hypothetical protein n=1 Tax=Parnassius apollo TaxID=110799 RepID=A0A8S3WWL0_PARAO|nr:unnamed protein product [Parnassius apollo]
MTSVQEFSCIFCKEVFEDKETLQVHFRKHGDPKFDQTAKAKVRNQNDSPTSVDTSKDDNEMVSCDVCPEVFPTISKAITHKHKLHPDHDAKYFCPWCGKLFTLKHLFNKHLLSSHDSSSFEVTNNFHCDCCDVDFYNTSAMVYHNKFYHRQDTDLPAIGHSKKLKLLNQELVQIYYCPFCGEEYNNKVNLHKHMTDDHSDENQTPEDILRCPLCEAVFYHLDAYELHLTFHSSEDLYSEENEMLKQIVEFSLDTIPPLIEKVEIDAIDEENEDLKTIGIDQFLQLSMSKDSEEEQLEQTEKIKAKKHKKHKKSKKAITLDEFLNMNADVFGEGLNFQGIEEVPTRVVAKQLKPKKEQGIKNQEKKVALSSDIDKLKKQGITIKMKPGKKLAPSKITEQPSSSMTNKANLIKSNVISTSSEVLSKLMSQSNSQIKIMKKPTLMNQNVEQNEKKITKAETYIKPQDVNYFDKEANQYDLKQSKGIDNENTMSAIDEKSNDALSAKSDVTSKDIEGNFHKSLVSTDTLPENYTNYSAPLNESLDKDNIVYKKDNENDVNINDNKSDTFTNEVLCKGTEVLKAEVIQDIKKHTITTAGQTLNDFEEDLSSTKILRANTNEINEKKFAEDETVTEPSQNVTNNTLNAIKHLSHLITVKSINNSKSSPVKKEDYPLNDISQNQAEDCFNEIEDKKSYNIDEIETSIGINKSVNQKESEPKTLDALKNIGKHVTVKSLSSQVSSPKSVVDKFSDDSDNEKNNDGAENVESTYRSLANNIVGRKVVNLKNQNKLGTITKDSQIGSPMQNPTNKVTIKNTINKKSLLNEDEDINKSNSNADLLKRLTNVTAKSITSKKNIKQEHTIETSMHVTNFKKSSITERVMSKHEVNEDIEIFNIDDSDSDGQDKQDFNKRIETTKLSINPVSVNKTGNVSSDFKSHEALKNLGKGITVKAGNQSVKSQSNFKDEENISEHSDTFTDEDEDVDINNIKDKMSVKHFINQSNNNLQSTLKNLGKNITVKSNNSSLNLPLRKTQDKNTQNIKKIYKKDTENDSDSNVGKIKITEITDDIASDNDFFSDEDESKYNKKNSLQSPNVANSDMEDDFAEEETYEDFSDGENSSHQAKIFNKEITIRPLKEQKCSIDTDSDTRGTNKDASNISNNIKESCAKQFTQKQNIKPDNLPAATTTSLTPINENIGTTSNQMNTVNKEVSVKTFESQTVIEEITTTVTKTIRTVNQTVKHEVKNTGQINSNATFRPQKIANYSQQGKNTQNITFRHPSPSIGTKIKNATTPIRSPSNITVRPSNQLVPVRTGLNLTKPCNSTMPKIRNKTPFKPPNQKPVTGRALKISPQAMNQSMKRPSVDTSGELSCFKKPKETFPLQIPTYKGDQDGDATMHFSASQSRSDFTSTVKNVQGKSVVTSTQMKSEMSTSSHLSKLGKMSGLKIVKTSSKQATQVEERIESCGAKRTMEALQKLQMQGLLVKRPRTDSNDDNEFSNSGSETEEANE